MCFRHIIITSLYKLKKIDFKAFKNLVHSHCTQNQNLNLIIGDSKEFWGEKPLQNRLI